MMSHQLSAASSRVSLKVSCVFQVLTVGGSSDHIDVFTNLSYRAFSLSF